MGERRCQRLGGADKGVEVALRCRVGGLVGDRTVLHLELPQGNSRGLETLPFRVLCGDSGWCCVYGYGHRWPRLSGYLSFYGERSKQTGFLIDHRLEHKKL